VNAKKITMQSIADELGISKVSVSKALNNQPGVSQKLKDTIFNKAKEVGYTRTRRRESYREVSQLGLLVSHRFFFENEQFYSKIYLFLHQACTRRKIGLYLHVINENEDIEQLFASFIRAHNFDGLFLTGDLDDAFLSMLSDQSFAVVAVDFYKANMPIDSVVIDNYYASLLATSYLIEKGHTEIGFLGNPKSTSSVSDRFYGYLKALNQNDIEYRKEWHIAENYEAGMFTHKFSLPSPLPTSFVCHCDSAAYQLMLILRGQRLNIPQEISLIAFDNTDTSHKSDPQITTIDIDKREIAHKALTQMIWRINNPLEDPQRVELNTHLIERQTVRSIL
jgi:LacI family transcriptional regulator